MFLFYFDLFCFAFYCLFVFSFCFVLFCFVFWFVLFLLFGVCVFFFFVGCVCICLFGCSFVCLFVCLFVCFLRKNITGHEQYRQKHFPEAADEEAPRKRLTSLLKMALDLMDKFVQEENSIILS